MASSAPGIVEALVSSNKATENGVSTLASKLGCMEMRQCQEATSNKNDVIRQLDQWSSGETAFVSEGHLEAYKQQAIKQPLETTYGGIMLDKDKRRIEYIATQLYLRATEEEWKEVTLSGTSIEQTGWHLQRMPSFMQAMKIA